MLGREIVKIHQHWWRRSKKKAGSQDHNASQCSPSSASCLSYQTSSPAHPHPAPLKSSSQPSQALPSRRPTPPGAFLPHLLLLPSPLLTRSLFTYKRDGPLDLAFVWVPRLLTELHFFWYFHVLDISPKRLFHQKVAWREEKFGGIPSTQASFKLKTFVFISFLCQVFVLAWSNKILLLIPKYCLGPSSFWHDFTCTFFHIRNPWTFVSLGLFHLWQFSCFLCDNVPLLKWPQNSWSNQMVLPIFPPLQGPFCDGATLA